MNAALLSRHDVYGGGAEVWMVAIGLLGLALAGSPVPLVPVDPPAPVPLVRVDEPPAPASDTRFGVGLGVGLPSGLELAPYVRPASWLQLQGGLAHDGAALGISAGLLVGALNAVFTPTLSLDAGHFFQGDLSGSLSHVMGIDLSRYPSARNFDFDHVDAQVGLLLGSSSVQFFLRGGASVVHATLHDFGASLQAATHDATLTAQDPTLTAWVPSARAGLLVTF